MDYTLLTLVLFSPKFRNKDLEDLLNETNDDVHLEQDVNYMSLLYVSFGVSLLPETGCYHGLPWMAYIDIKIMNSKTSVILTKQGSQYSNQEKPSLSNDRMIPPM